MGLQHKLLWRLKGFCVINSEVERDFTLQNEDAPECTVHIFVDKDNNDKQLPGVVEFMKRLPCPVHPELEAKADVSLM